MRSYSGDGRVCWGLLVIGSARRRLGGRWQRGNCPGTVGGGLVVLRK